MIDSDEQSIGTPALREKRKRVTPAVALNAPGSAGSHDFHEYGRFLSISLPALEVPVAA